MTKNRHERNMTTHYNIESAGGETDVTLRWDSRPAMKALAREVAAFFRVRAIYTRGTAVAGGVRLEFTLDVPPDFGLCRLTVELCPDFAVYAELYDVTYVLYDTEGVWNGGMSTNAVRSAGEFPLADVAEDALAFADAADVYFPVGRLRECENAGGKVSLLRVTKMRNGMAVSRRIFPRGPRRAF